MLKDGYYWIRNPIMDFDFIAWHYRGKRYIAGVEGPGSEGDTEIEEAHILRPVSVPDDIRICEEDND